MLQLEQVSYRYRDAPRPALQDFSLRLEAGKVVALLGPNGAGKSTALALAAGWLKPATGRRSGDRQTAWLPQSERLSFAFTALEYVLFGRAPHLPFLQLPRASDEGLARRALERCGVAGLAGRRITTLSGGELQLVRLARCVAQEAHSYLLDEPTDMLDPAHIVQVALIIRSLSAEGQSILFTTHDISFAQHCAHEVVLLKAGRIAAAGPSADILTTERLQSVFEVPFALRQVPLPEY
ncbi:MAG: ABC transporter ATP-binding protein [Spirochaetes bacterium]|nr:ABC transporter ATP-binding protein [Spirochaetota bacterium]MBU0956895.1 ABC transporter ATP-binding protein [Spirochaetota bacterium]